VHTADNHAFGASAYQCLVSRSEAELLVGVGKTSLDVFQLHGDHAARLLAQVLQAQLDVRRHVVPLTATARARHAKTTV